jgi:hypothetical protein
VELKGKLFTGEVHSVLSQGAAASDAVKLVLSAFPFQ